MELHKAIKEIVASKGAGMINNIQIICCDDADENRANYGKQHIEDHKK